MPLRKPGRNNIYRKGRKLSIQAGPQEGFEIPDLGPIRKTYEGVAAADFKAVHSQYFFPRNVILTASGDFNKAELKNKIKTF